MLGPISWNGTSALAYAVLAALGNVVGALAVSHRLARGLLVIEHSVAFGAGVMLAVAITELLPEAVARSGPAAPLLGLAGPLGGDPTPHTPAPPFYLPEGDHA